MYDTLFLDRDGVINKKLEGRYVTNFNEFIFIENSCLYLPYIAYLIIFISSF